MDELDRQRRAEIEAAEELEEEPRRGGNAVAPGRLALTDLWPFGSRMPPGPVAPGKLPRTATPVFRSARGAAPELDGDIESLLDEADRSPARPLPAALRGELERALGVDLGAVKLHDGAASREAAEALEARAFARGLHVHLAAPPGDLEAPAARRLVAHEIYHVVDPAGSAARVSQPGDPGERRADAFAERFAGGQAAPAPRSRRAAPGGTGDAVFRQERVAENQPNTPSTGLGRLRSEYRHGSRREPGVLTVTLLVHIYFTRPNEWPEIRQRAYRSNYKAIIERFWSRRYQLRRGRAERADVDVRVEFAATREAADIRVSVSPGARGDRDFVSRPMNAATPRQEGEPLDPTQRPRRPPADEHLSGQSWDESLRSAPDSSPAPGDDGHARTVATLACQPRSTETSDAFALRGVLAELRSTSHGPHSIEVQAWGHTGPDEGTGAERRDLALRRAEAARDRLGRASADRSLTFVAVPARLEPQGRPSVEIKVARRSQVTPAHEAGHMLGLGDEYTEDGREGQARGDAADHSGLAERLGMEPVLVGDDPDSVMARGNQVEPHHYVTFAEQIARLTGTRVEQWRIVPPGSD